MKIGFNKRRALTFVGLIALALMTSVLVAAARDLKPIADWVSDPNAGRRDAIGPVVIQQLHLGDGRTEPYPGLKKGYRDTSTGVRYVFMTLNLRGKREIVLAREDGVYQVMWHASQDGQIIATVLLDITQKTVEAVPNAKYSVEFEATVNFFFERLPK